MINKEQILVIPVNYVSKIGNKFTGISSFTKKSYSVFDSNGIYEPRYKIDNNICFVKPSIVMLFKNDDKYLVKELLDLSCRPCIELGINSFIYPESGNYNALLNQMNIILEQDLKLNKKNVSYEFIGYIRDLANESIKSVLGSIYYVKTDKIPKLSNNSIYQYKWYTIDELVDRYSKATSWSKILIDLLLIETIKI